MRLSVARYSSDQVALVPGALLAAQVCWSCWPDGNEPGLDQDTSRGCVAVSGGGSERANAVPNGGKIAQVSHRRGRHTLSAYALGDSITEFGGLVSTEDKVEPAKHRRVAGDEHVERADARLLLGHQLVMSFREMLEVRFATVGDRRSEERSIGQLELQHRRRVIRLEKLQLGHFLTLSGVPARSFRRPSVGR